MRALVNGVTGQVGGAILKALSPVVATVSADRATLDLAQPERIAETLDRLNPELIINPAAYTAVDRAEEESEIAFRINADSPGVIAQWAAVHRVPMIHFSTDYVFDGSGTRPWKEGDRPKPLSVYGASKLAGERAIQSAGCSHLIIRTSWVYAAEGKNFLRTISKLAAENRELRIVADQIGAPTSARCIAEIVAAIVNQPIEALAARFAAAGGIVNVATSGETSWHGFAVAIVKGLKARGLPLDVEDIVPIATRDYATRAIRPANSRLDLRRLAAVFGIVPPAWDQALVSELDLVAKDASPQ